MVSASDLVDLGGPLGSDDDALSIDDSGDEGGGGGGTTAGGAGVPTGLIGAPTGGMARSASQSALASAGGAAVPSSSIAGGTAGGGGGMRHVQSLPQLSMYGGMDGGSPPQPPLQLGSPYSMGEPAQHAQPGMVGIKQEGVLFGMSNGGSGMSLMGGPGASTMVCDAGWACPC